MIKISRIRTSRLHLKRMFFFCFQILYLEPFVWKMIYRLFNFFIFYYFRSLLKTRRMAKQVGLLTAVLFYYFRSLLRTRRMAKQVGLLTAGCQPWNFDVVAASGDRFVYCATLCVYIYQVFL